MPGIYLTMRKSRTALFAALRMLEEWQLLRILFMMDFMLVRYIKLREIGKNLSQKTHLQYNNIKYIYIIRL